MATNHTNRLTIIGRVGLLGASLGIGLGLFEAGCLRLTNWPLNLNRPHVPFAFWFFAPLLGAITFGLLGLLVGLLASLPKTRILGMLMIAAFVGSMAYYAALVLQFSQSVGGWYVSLHHFFAPPILFALAFVWTVPALWDTRKPGSPLGFLGDVRQRLWSWTVFGLMATLAVAVGVGYFPDHLPDSTAHATGISRSPNIVLIVWDTTRADHFSSYGYPRKTTPNVDEFAKHGVLFENAISASSWTLPSMASVFTSLLPHQHGASSDLALGQGPRTLAEILSSSGYETAGFNGNPHFGVAPWGLNRGFETYNDSTGSLGYSFGETRLGEEFIAPYSEKLFGRGRFIQYTAPELNEQVYRWLDHRSDRPFFLFVNYNDAHEPYETPSLSNLYGRVSENAKPLLHEAKFGRFYLPPPDREKTIAAYDECLNYIDDQVGALLENLERSPQWSNTYVIITADHGEAFGEHGTYTHAWNLYRELLHVPLIIAGPGIPQGRRVSDIAKTRQIFSTVLQMAGMDNPVLRRGSLSRLWEPNYVPSMPQEPNVSEVLDTTPVPAPQGLISLTTTEWQFIYHAGDNRNELFHWTTDPLEQHNVAYLPENKALVEQLHASLVGIVKGSYRPWRDTRYLLAFSKSDFSPEDEALKTLPMPQMGPLIPRGVGATQVIFPPNPETPLSPSKSTENDLLKSLPYDGP